MGDRFMLFRMMCKEVARGHGYEATFMPKPWSDKTGGGAHFNMSLASAETGANLFEPEGEDQYGCGISPLGYQFIAGILRHAAAIVAVTAPTVNSYKRLIKRGAMSGSTWAPVFISYGRNNRTHMLRVPTKSPRVESRAVDASVNAYLGAAMVLAAGLEAIDEGADPGPPIDLDMYVQRDAKLLVNRRQHVVDVDRAVLRHVAAACTTAHDHSRLDAATCKHHGEHIGPVVATRFRVNLRRSPELAQNRDERCV